MNYVYKITNKINGKYYIGKRQHPNPVEDSYMGSGKQIVAAIKKYGTENFSKDILKIFETDEEAALFEASLVTKDMIASPMTYNMHEGGYGGFAHLNDGSSKHRSRAAKGGKVSIQQLQQHPNSQKGKFSKNNSRTKDLSKKANQIKTQMIAVNPDVFLEARRKISEHQTKNNSMFGRIWIFKDSEKKVIREEELSDYKALGWISAAEKNQVLIAKMKTRWINKNGTNKLIDVNLLNSYIIEGWKLGRTSGNSNS